MRLMPEQRTLREDAALQRQHQACAVQMLLRSRRQPRDLGQRGVEVRGVVEQHATTETGETVRHHCRLRL